jgi:hypothetical protein
MLRLHVVARTPSKPMLGLQAFHSFYILERPYPKHELVQGRGYNYTHIYKTKTI